MKDHASISIDQLFERAQQPVYSAQRRSRMRTLITLVILIFLLTLIGAYWFITDPQRVRQVSQSYLSDLIGGPVTIQHASLSIFEGLRLDGIRILVDSEETPDSILLEAKSLHVGYNPAALLIGRIEATRILAIEPRIHLTEDVDSGMWNFQKLKTAGPRSTSGGQKTLTIQPFLPEIVLRNARFDYAQIMHGRRSQVGSLSIEGQLVPDVSEGIYRFRLQSRGGTSGVFPIAEGWLEPSVGQLGLVLRDVEFVDEIKTILPAVVRRFWEQHHLAGRIGETRVRYFRRDSGRAGFRVETDLDGVRLIVPPEQWIDGKERARIDRWETTLSRLASTPLGGSSVARLLIHSIQPTPLQLDEVDGTFVFTDESISISGLVARIENNRFSVEGQIAGYEPTSDFRLKVSSLRTENIRIPEAPRYIRAMPWSVQEIYYRFRPAGEASFWLEIARSASQKPLLRGQIQVHNATFTFDRFPYPIDRASGIMEIDRDPETGLERLRIVSIKGYGYQGGANENATVEVSGTVSPLDDHAGADILVRGENLVSERLLIESMPPQTRQTVKRFDADQTGQLPTFEGAFECRIRCPQGPSRHWDIVTFLDIRKAKGKLSAFPYPLEDMSMQLAVHDTFIQIEQARMDRDGGQILLTGRVDWSKRIPGTSEPLVQTDLKLEAKDIPVDEVLINALPEKKRQWLRDLGLKGRLDVKGKIIPQGPDSDEPIPDLELILKEGTLRAPGQNLEAEQLIARGRLTASKAVISHVSGYYKKSSLEGQASVDWTQEDKPVVVASGQVRDLVLDLSLVQSLPDRQRRAVEMLGASGTIDLDFDYAAGGYRVVIRLRSLSLLPPKLGIIFRDVGGRLVLNRDVINFEEVTARWGDAVLHASGTFEPRTGKLRCSLSGRDVLMDENGLKGLPESFRSRFRSVDPKGKLSFDFSRITVDPNGKSNDVGFEGSLWLEDVSLNPGLGLKGINGVFSGKGQIVEGKIKTFEGSTSLDSLEIAGRGVEKLTATVVKPIDQDLLQVSKIDGKIAGGQIGGQIDTLISSKDPRFGLLLVLRNANVQELTGDMEKSIDGRLTASLSLEGRWDDPTSRRGRGDVSVEGQQMYRVPVLFGLMQIANLTLPVDDPLHQAGVRYSVEGRRVVLDAIDLRGKGVVMQGNGWIDFSTRKVQMSLVMANSAADAVPIFGDLIRGARQDLLQIRVKGSLEEPKFGASALNTITTTIDEVLKGEK